MGVSGPGLARRAIPAQMPRCWQSSGETTSDAVHLVECWNWPRRPPKASPAKSSRRPASRPKLTGVYKNPRLGVVNLTFRCRILDG